MTLTLDVLSYKILGVYFTSKLTMYPTLILMGEHIAFRFINSLSTHPQINLIVCNFANKTLHRNVKNKLDYKGILVHTNTVLTLDMVFLWASSVFIR